MTGYVFGRVVEPHPKQLTVKGSKRTILQIGILAGRILYNIDIFDDDRIFEKASVLSDGDQVIAVISDSVDDRGRTRYYLNRIGDCPEGLNVQIESLVS